MDPFTGAVASNVAANVVTTALGRVAKVVTRSTWESADEVGRLFWLLDAGFSEELPGLTYAELERTWRQDDELRSLLIDLQSNPRPELQVPALVQAIEPLVGPTESETPRQLAVRLSRAIPQLLAEAKPDSTRVLHELQKIGETLEQQSEQLDRIEAQQSPALALIIASDWPASAEDAMRRAAAEDSAGTGSLVAALKDKDRSVELPKLVNNPKAWMSDFAPETWELFAELCEDEGLWDVAKQAWLNARDKPGADYAGCSVRAAEAVVQLGDRKTGGTLLDEARADDSSHPFVLFQDALAETDLERSLELLSGIETDEARMQAMVELARATAFAELDDLASAKASLHTVREAGAEKMLAFRMTSSAVAVKEVMWSAQPSGPATESFIEEGLALEQELLKRSQRSQAAGVRAQLSAFPASLGDFPRAGQMLKDAVAEYREDGPDARLALAMAAAHVNSMDVVRALVHDEDEQLRARYLRARLLADGDEADQDAAAAEYEQLLTEDHEAIQRLAALRRLDLAGQAPRLGWHEPSADIVRAIAVAPEMVYRTSWLEADGRRDEAERELLQYFEEDWAVIELMNLMARGDEWARAAKYAETVLKRDADWTSRLGAADVFRRAGDTKKANTLFEGLGENSEAPVYVRAAAYQERTKAAGRAQDHPATAQFAEKWLEQEPDSADAGWAQVLALAMLGHDEVALELFERLGLHPRHSDEYRITAQLLVNNRNSVEALETVIGFADEHDPPDEALEALIFFAAAKTREEMPERLRPRISWQRFSKLFPHSERVQARSIEDLRKYIEVDLAERAKHIQEVADGVFKAADTPTAVLAAVSGNHMSALWTRLSWTNGLPLGHGDPGLEEAERADARAALTGAAVWDGTSIFIAAGDDLADRLRTSLPGSVVTQAALADIAEGVRDLVVKGDGERKEFGYNLEAGQPEFREWDPAVTEEFEAGIRRTQELAFKLTAVPDQDPEHPQDLDELIQDDDASVFRAHITTFGAAQRLGRPIYSDDRDVRRTARQAGVPAFGTLALLDALADENFITPDERSAARRRLLRKGGLGVKPSGDELTLWTAEADWQPTTEVRVAAADPGTWRFDPADYLHTWLSFLQDVHEQAPTQLAPWVARVLDGIGRGRPDIGLQVHARHMVMLSLIPHEGSTAFFRSLLLAIRDASRLLKVPLDMSGVPAFLQFMQLLAGYQRIAEARIFALRVWGRLPLHDQERTFKLIFGGF